MGRAEQLTFNPTRPKPPNPPYRDPNKTQTGVNFSIRKSLRNGQALISLGANVNAQTDAGFTALHLVAHLMQRLLGGGSDWSYRTWYSIGL